MRASLALFICGIVSRNFLTRDKGIGIYSSDSYFIQCSKLRVMVLDDVVSNLIEYCGMFVEAFVIVGEQIVGDFLKGRLHEVHDVRLYAD